MAPCGLQEGRGARAKLLLQLSEQLGDAIGGLVINEVLAVARSLPMGVKYRGRSRAKPGSA